MNIKKNIRTISSLLRAVSPAPRLRILLGIGTGEACVCHLEALLGWRQAYISQHLMALRKARVLSSRREGRFVYYRLQNPRILDLIELAAEMEGLNVSPMPMVEGCACPTCSPEGVLVTAASI